MGAQDQQRITQRPAVEWIAGGIGLLITLGLIGFIGWQALQDPPGTPQIEIRVTSIAPQGDSHLVEITAFNRGNSTVAGLVVEGTLTLPGRPSEKSSTTFDYVPAHSQRRGGLYFRGNPREGDLEIHAKGYQRP